MTKGAPVCLACTARIAVPRWSSAMWKTAACAVVIAESRSSHLMEGTIMQKYLKENRIQVQEPKESIAYYLKGETNDGLQFKAELAKIL
jgi:hypothetical protein